MQIPNGWFFEWEEGANPLDPDPWNVWVRPEARVLHRSSLPAHEHTLFIYDGDYTVKVFKEYGAISFRFLADIYLEPGSYLFEINVFPDLIVGYTADNQKIWAPDILSGEVRFVVGNGGSGWILPQFGRRNTLTFQFGVTEGQTLRVGVAIRGRWAIMNNGWFLDAWSLRRVSG